MLFLLRSDFSKYFDTLASILLLLAIFATDLVRLVQFFFLWSYFYHLVSLLSF